MRGSPGVTPFLYVLKEPLALSGPGAPPLYIEAVFIYSCMHLLICAWHPPMFLAHLLCAGSSLGRGKQSAWQPDSKGVDGLMGKEGVRK